MREWLAHSTDIPRGAKRNDKLTDSSVNSTMPLWPSASTPSETTGEKKVSNKNRACTERKADKESSLCKSLILCASCRMRCVEFKKHRKQDGEERRTLCALCVPRPPQLPQVERQLPQVESLEVHEKPQDMGETIVKIRTKSEFPGSLEDELSSTLPWSSRFRALGRYSVLVEENAVGKSQPRQRKD